MEPDSPENNERQSITTAADIIRAHGRDSVVIPQGFLEGENSKNGGFLKGAGFTTDSSIGHFIILTDAIHWTSTELRNFIFDRTKRGSIEPSTAVRAQIAERQTSLQALRDVRKEIGRDIFGEDLDKYTLEVENRFRNGPTGDSPTIREKKRTWYREFGNDIRDHFPLTSK
jgi:hypothetical protein